jgi:NTP pyrophosphatase (non-canonical NTP hydrolase)
MDQLKEMFRRQYELAGNFIPIDHLFIQQDFDPARQRYLASYLQLLNEEGVEMLRELPGRKFWRPSIQPKPVDVKALKEELADIFHIVIALALIAGVSAEEMYELYCEKNDINMIRVKNNS